jgi:DNA-binding NarL/FixJ family response regulator
MSTTPQIHSDAWRQALCKDPFLFAVDRPRPLTKREISVIQKISEGLSNKEIAFELGLTPGSVHVYVHLLFKKLGLSRRLEVALWAREHQDFFGPLELRFTRKLLEIAIQRE